jgi:Leucine-rich repeat (LRR) protein
MKQLLLMIAVVALVGGCGKREARKLLSKEESAKVIEAAIRKELKKPTGELTEADLEKVTELPLWNNQLTSVKGLEKLTQLEELMLTGNRLTKLPEGLEDLTQLTWLNLGHNELTDVKGLEKLDQLKTLLLHDNQLTDVKGLEKLTKLTQLHLYGNQLTDVTGLEKLTQLKWLHLYVNQLTDVTGLEKLTQLEELWLMYNPDLTKAQIAELQKALPDCRIYSDPTK